MPMPELRARAAALAKIAYLMQYAGHYYRIRTTGTEWSLIPEIHAK